MSNIAITNSDSVGKRAAAESTLSNPAERSRAERTAPNQAQNRPSWKHTFAFPAYSGLLEIV